MSSGGGRREILLKTADAWQELQPCGSSSAVPKVLIQRCTLADNKDRKVIMLKRDARFRELGPNERAFSRIRTPMGILRRKMNSSWILGAEIQKPVQFSCSAVSYKRATRAQKSKRRFSFRAREYLQRK